MTSDHMLATRAHRLRAAERASATPPWPTRGPTPIRASSARREVPFGTFVRTGATACSTPGDISSQERNEDRAPPVRQPA
jgi:hypothetical protein